MALTDSLPTADPGGLTVDDERLLRAGLVARNADGSPRVGVFPAGTGVLVTGRASMGYDIAPFLAVTSRTGTGVELVANDATVTNIPTDPAPGANSRIDVIYVRPQFTARADTGNVPVFGVAKGVAAGVPTKPGIPAGALELATAVIPSSATTTASVVITQTAPLTAAAGGIVPLRSTAELTAFVAADGTTARLLDTGALVRRQGGAWVAERAFRALQVLNAASGWTVTSPSVFGPLTTSPAGQPQVTTPVTVPVACRAKVTVAFKFSANAVGCGALVGVAASGATTITPAAGDVTNVQVLQQAVNQTNTYIGSWLINLNAGTTTLAVVGQAIGVGGIRAIATIELLVEPVSE